METRGADLHGVSVLGSSPALAAWWVLSRAFLWGLLCGFDCGLKSFVVIRVVLDSEVWTHGLGGSCEADELRGLDHVLDPGKLGNRTVLRFDLRGHGRSAGAHDPARGHEQYTWPELAKDLRRAAADSVSRCFYGGEALGAAVALHAAVAATSTGSVDAPPGLVLMRPPQALAQVARGVVDAAWQDQMRQLAATLEKQGFEALEAMEKADNGPLLNGAASFTEADLEQLFALRRAMGKVGGPVFHERQVRSDKLCQRTSLKHPSELERADASGASGDARGRCARTCGVSAAGPAADRPPEGDA